MKGKSNMLIEVEILGGTRIDDVISEAIEKARMWGVAYVKFNFNGVDFAIGAGADPEQVLAEYHEMPPVNHICAA